MGYHIQTNNNDNLLSLDFGLQEFGIKTNDERFIKYREYVYEKGSLSGIEKERSKGFEIKPFDRFRYRTRYFTDSGVIGTKVFV